MKTSIVLVGAIVLIIGIALVGYGYSSGTSQNTTSSTPVVPSTSRNIDANGIWTAGSHTLQQGQNIAGSYSVTNVNGSAGHIFFLIFNESQWANWGPCVPCSSPNLLNRSVSGSSSFTWTVPSSGAFYFAIDDSSYSQALNATFSANSTQTVNSATSTNPTYVYAGVGLLIVGAIILAIGIIVGGASKVPKTSPTPPPTTNAPTESPRT